MAANLTNPYFNVCPDNLKGLKNQKKNVQLYLKLQSL